MANFGNAERNPEMQGGGEQERERQEDNHQHQEFVRLFQDLVKVYGRSKVFALFDREDVAESIIEKYLSSNKAAWPVAANRVRALRVVRALHQQKPKLPEYRLPVTPQVPEGAVETQISSQGRWARYLVRRFQDKIFTGEEAGLNPLMISALKNAGWLKKAGKGVYLMTPAAQQKFLK